MVMAALRDLQWRRRRFAIAILGTALVFGMTLVLNGMSHGFVTEASGTVRGLRADEWIVPTGATGPFLGAIPFPATVAMSVRVPRAGTVAPVAFTRRDIAPLAHPREVNIFGALPGAPGMPKATRGRSPTRSGEIAVSSRLPHQGIGTTVVLGGRPYRVVGTVHNSTSLAGVPNVFLTLSDAQTVAYAGSPLAAALAVRGHATIPPPQGFKVVGNHTARADIFRAVIQGQRTVMLVALLLWVVAATIVGSVVYLSALERQRDFAVFKATGVSTRAILAGLAAQAVLVSLTAAILGLVIANLLGPRFPLPVSITAGTQALLPAVAIVVGLVASLAGLRRVVTVDPALAFGGP
jgi:putative ABC transport system permease protein